MDGLTTIVVAGLVAIPVATGLVVTGLVATVVAGLGLILAGLMAIVVAGLIAIIDGTVVGTGVATGGNAETLSEEPELSPIVDELTSFDVLDRGVILSE